MTFGQAITELSIGNRVARRGWNGKDMYLIQIWNWNVDHQDVYITNIQDKTTLSFIAIKNVRDELVPWVASQEDALSTDWVCYGHEVNNS